jgi:hypothetical protein
MTSLLEEYMRRSWLKIEIMLGGFKIEIRREKKGGPERERISMKKGEEETESHVFFRSKYIEVSLLSAAKRERSVGQSRRERKQEGM